MSLHESSKDKCHFYKIGLPYDPVAYMFMKHQTCKATITYQVISNHLVIMVDGKRKEGSSREIQKDDGRRK